jgi:hypothetical protein
MRAREGTGGTTRTRRNFTSAGEAYLVSDAIAGSRWADQLLAGVASHTVTSLTSTDFLPTSLILQYS